MLTVPVIAMWLTFTFPSDCFTVTSRYPVSRRLLSGRSGICNESESPSGIPLSGLAILRSNLFHLDADVVFGTFARAVSDFRIG